MTIVMFRVDASSAIGTGHLMRCLTLATGLRASGAKVAFISRTLPGDYVRWLEERGHHVCALPTVARDTGKGHAPYLSWLGVDMDTEIAQSRAAIEQVGTPDWLVVDHYALDEEWETAVRPLGTRLLVVDDLANRPHRADLLLDQNYYADASQRYERLAVDAEMLLGPRFALLRPEFAGYRTVRSGEIKNILVFMGGSDNANVTTTVLGALGAVKRRNWRVDVVLGKANTHADEIGDLCAHQGAQLLLQVNDMASRMARVDLSIGATGTATWERACVGLPTLAVSVAENQRQIAHNAHELGILRWLGDVSHVAIEDWIQALEWAFTHPTMLRQQSERGMQLVDGLGAARVVERMLENSRRLQ